MITVLAHQACSAWFSSPNGDHGPGVDGDHDAMIFRIDVEV